MPEADAASPFLEKLTPEVQALVQELRPLIKDVLPDASERVHMGWKVIQYATTTSMRDMIVALVPQRGYVNLEFADGVDLPDGAQLLEGTGKRLRHVKIRSAKDVQSQEVRDLLQAAARLRAP